MKCGSNVPKYMLGNVVLLRMARKKAEKDGIPAQMATGGGVRKKYIVWRANDDFLREIIGESDTVRGAQTMLTKKEKAGDFNGYSRYGFDDTKDYFFIKEQYQNYSRGGEINGWNYQIGGL